MGLAQDSLICTVEFLPTGLTVMFADGQSCSYASHVLYSFISKGKARSDVPYSGSQPASALNALPSETMSTDEKIRKLADFKQVILLARSANLTSLELERRAGGLSLSEVKVVVDTLTFQLRDTAQLLLSVDVDVKPPADS